MNIKLSKLLCNEATNCYENEMLRLKIESLKPNTSLSDQSRSFEMKMKLLEW